MVSGPDLTPEDRPDSVPGAVPPPDLTPEAAVVPPPPPPWNNGFPPPPPEAGYPGAYGYPAYAVAVPKPEPLPIEPRQFQEFYRAPAFRWWKPLAAMGLFAIVWLVVSIPPITGAMLWETARTGRPMTVDLLETPLGFLANNVTVVLAIPVALLTHWLIYRQRPRWLSSIAGRFRWGIFGRFMATTAVIMLVSYGIQAYLGGGVGTLVWNENSLFLLIGILVTTPFQAAGEEYMMRGLVFRSVSSWFNLRWLGLIVGIIVNATIFMLLHGAGDPWLISYYLLVAVLFSILVWRTGGLEAAIAMHVINNLIGEIALPFQPDQLARIFDRQAGVAGPETLIQMGVTVLVAAALLWQASRLKLPRTNAPAALAQPQASSGLV